MGKEELKNPLLLRQIRKYIGSVENIPEDILPLLQAVNQSYQHYDGDRELIERAMELSSEELQESNQRLKSEISIHHKTLNQLKESLASLESDDNEELDKEDILKVAEYLSSEINKRKDAEEALKKSRREYKILVETAQDIIYRVDEHGYFTYMNPIAYRLSGYSEEEVLSMKYTDVVRDDYKNRVTAFYIKQVRDKVTSTYLEFPLKIKKDRELWVGQNVQLILDGDNYMGIQAVARDITEIRRIRNDLKKAKTEAEASSKAKEAFLANMSHEIRTPMNAIVGMTRLLKQTEVTEEQNKYLQAISTSSSNLIVLINDILDLSKIESGKLELENLGFRLSDLVEALYYSQKITADEKEIDLHYTIESSIPKILKGDPYRLNQILTNLVNNAIKFTQSGRVELTIKLIEKDQKKCSVFFSVKDTGIGIPQSKLNEIFESFSQADSSITRKFGGTGLGLSITKYLVHMMNGALSVDSVFGQGTEFIVEIPFETATKVEVNVIEEIDTHSFNMKGVRVLLVEDNRINRMLVSSLFKKWNVSFDWSENGEEAIGFLKENEYDLVLMDMQMPVMGGIEATQIIRNELNLDIPIIALTANAFSDDAKRCLKSGMNDVIIKPFEPSLLYNKIIKQLYERKKVLN